MSSPLPPVPLIPPETPHIHGCGHPVRTVVLCDDPFSLIASRWVEWYEENDCESGGPCICYFCWKERDDDG